MLEVNAHYKKLRSSKIFSLLETADFIKQFDRKRELIFMHFFSSTIEEGILNIFEV